MARVLIVDDEQSIRISSQEILRDEGHSTRLAETSEEALAALDAEEFDVVLSDIYLPRTSGINLLKTIKSRFAHVQVILMTGDPDVETAAEAVREGAFDYLPKPVRKHELTRVVASAAQVKSLEEERRRLEAENLEYSENLEKLVEERTIALRNSEQNYRMLAEDATDFIWRADRNMNFMFVNPAIHSTLGVSAEDVLGRPIESFMATSSYDAVVNFFRRSDAAPEFDSDRSIYELEFLHSKGSVVWAESALRRLHDDDGEPIGLLGVSRDVTRRRLSEQASRRAQKMEAVGQLTGGISHDFNNILGIILGNVELLQPQVANDENMMQCVSAIRRSAERASGLTQQLLAFSRRQEPETTVVDTNHVIRSMGEIISKFVSPQAQVEHRLQDDLWLTETDPGNFEDAVLNLAINASDAMKNGGKLLIETTNQTIDDRFIAEHPGSSRGEYVRISVSDTGEGIPADLLEHIFEPFFTTKAEGEGSGLGLSMVFGFVRRAGGYVLVDSVPGSGTTVSMFLPRSTQSEIHHSGHPDTDTPAHYSLATLLIVDDEEDLLSLAKLSLESLNYDVLTASSGSEALKVLRNHPEVSLMFSDVVMPGGMNGVELAKQALELRPDLKLLLTSGYSGEVTLEKEHSPQIGEILQKPYSQSELARRIHNLLDSVATTVVL